MARVLVATLHKEGRRFVAECPDVGTVSQGSSIEKAVRNLREATELYLEEFAPEEPRCRLQFRTQAASPAGAGPSGA